MTHINGRDLIPPELLERDPLVLHAKRKAEMKAEQERWERRRRPKLDICPMTPAEVDQRVAADQEAQNAAIGQLVGELRAEIDQLREQVAELSKELAFAKGLLSGSGGGRLKFFTVRGQFREGERYDRTDVVTRGSAWYVAKRDDPRGVPGDDGEDWQIGPVGKQGERGEAGERGLRGREGAAGKDAPTIEYWWLDRKRYTVTPIMSDGKRGSTLELRGMFEQYHGEADVETMVERALRTPRFRW